MMQLIEQLRATLAGTAGVRPHQERIELLHPAQVKPHLKTMYISDVPFHQRGKSSRNHTVCGKDRGTKGCPKWRKRSCE